MSRLAAGTVPLARRLLVADRRRFGAAVVGVALALALLLLLDGLSAGIDERVTVYERRAGADLFVAQPGTTSLLGATSVLGPGTVEAVAATAGVDRADAVRGFFTVPEVGGTTIPSYVVGAEPGALGGPWELAAGRTATAPDEVVVGEQFAQRAGLGVGGTLEVVGRPFRVVGIAGDADMFMAAFLFMTHGATDLLLGSPGTTSFVLVSTASPAATRDALVAQGLHVLTADELAAGDLALKAQTYGAALSVMVALAAGVGILVIALSVYAAVSDRRRDFGIVAALGSPRRLLYRLAATQSVVLALVGLVAGLVLLGLGVAALGALKPQFAVVVGGGSLARAALAAVGMGLVAAVVPARRLVSTDPATAFRGS